jgi:hypothetical protein
MTYRRMRKSNLSDEALFGSRENDLEVDSKIAE